MGFKDFFSKQAGNPSGLFGRLIMSRIFEKGNADLNDLMLKLISPEETDHILEIGFGTGKLINDMAAITKRGITEGIELSDTMVSIAMKKNRCHIENGRAKIQQGRFEEMSYSDNFFDKICTANTIYFWANPVKTAEKILRILKPGGKLIIGFGDKEQLKKKALSEDVFSLYSGSEVKELLGESGFTGDIDIISTQGKSYILNCAVAVK